MSNDHLGDRCKRYENAFRTYLPQRLPVILRLDGKGFSSYTKSCKKPFDDKLIACMNDLAIHLCKNIQGSAIAYTQSDEISILLINYKDINSQGWFDNNIIKMCSVASGIASAYFSSISGRIFNELKLAAFDCRAFVVPKEDVNNVFLWRQNDATRNSVQMVARSMYSYKQLHGMNNSQLQDMIFNKGVNWNDLPTAYRRGRCIVKKQYINNGGIRNQWVVDNEIPVFSQNKNYIEQYVYPERQSENVSGSLSASA